MAAVTGSLVVELGLNTAKLVTGMKKAERRISDFSKRAKVMAKRIAKIGAVAVAAAAVGIAALAKSVANAGDKFQKMSISLGVSTEALSSLKHAAELSGASMQDIEKALKTVAKRANDAQAGLSTAVRSFEQLGISIEDSEGNLKSLDILLVESANAFAKMTDDTKAAALAQELFGKSGVNLLPLLKQGSEGIRKMQEEAKALGITFDKEAADQAALFNDELLRLQRTLGGVKTQIGQALLPVMTEMITDLKKIGIQVVTWVKANKELIDSKITETIIGLKAALEGLLTVLVPTVSFFGAVKDRIVLISQAAGLAAGGMIKWTAIITANHEELKQLVREAEAVIRVNEGLGRMWVSLSKPIQKTTENTKDLINNINIFGQKGSESFRKVQGVVVEFESSFKKLDVATIAFGERVAFVFSHVIYDVITRGTFNVKNLWRSMLDTMAYEISRFIASRAVITFLNILSGDVAAAKKSGGGLLAGLLGGGLIGGAIALFGGGGKPATTAIAPQPTATTAIIQGSKITWEFNKKILKKTENQVDLLNSISVSSQGIAESLGLMTDTFTSAASPFSPSGFTAFLDGIGRVVLGGIEKFGTVLFGPIIGSVASKLAGKGLIDIDERRIDRAVQGIAVGLKGMDIFSAFAQPEGTFTGREPGFIGPAINPNQITINVEGSIIAEQDLISTINAGIAIANEDVFDSSDLGEFGGKFGGPG